MHKMVLAHLQNSFIRTSRTLNITLPHPYKHPAAPFKKYLQCAAKTLVSLSQIC